MALHLTRNEYDGLLTSQTIIINEFLPITNVS